MSNYCTMSARQLTIPQHRGTGWLSILWQTTRWLVPRTESLLRIFDSEDDIMLGSIQQIHLAKGSLGNTIRIRWIMLKSVDQSQLPPSSSEGLVNLKSDIPCYDRERDFLKRRDHTLIQPGGSSNVRFLVGVRNNIIFETSHDSLGEDHARQKSRPLRRWTDRLRRSQARPLPFVLSH